MKTLIALLCLLALVACASTPQSRQLGARLPQNLPPAVELTATPFYPQTDYQCGPAALATVLNFHGVNTTPEALSHQVYIPGRKGSLQIEIAAAARHHAMLPYPLAPQLLDLFTEVAAGNPVLVLQNLGFDWYPQWHYAVVVGYDFDNAEIMLRSGTTKRRITSFEVFERTWQRAKHWALVIVPAAEIPATATASRYLQTAYAFEQTGHTEFAFTAYQSASQRWPQEPASWMTLGNMAYQQQDWPMAIHAFAEASRLTPGAIDSWNNLAYALHAYGCEIQAQRALECGLSISAHDENLLDSWQQLFSSAARKDHANCPQIACE